jgi:plastocyanin
MEVDKEKQKIDLNTKKVIVVSVIIIIALLVVILFPKKENKIIINKGGEETTSVPVVEETVMPVVPTTTDQFKTAVPVGTVVPDANTKLSDDQKKVIAVPTNVMPSAPGSGSNFRSFDIKAEAGVFTPSKIIVKVGDIVHINFTAVDRGYDIVFPSYNMSQVAKTGQAKILEFSAAEEGNFTYYCDICGGMNSSAKGNIIVVK